MIWLSVWQILWVLVLLAEHNILSMCVVRYKLLQILVQIIVWLSIQLKHWLFNYVITAAPGEKFETGGVN